MFVINAIIQKYGYEGNHKKQNLSKNHKKLHYYISSCLNSIDYLVIEEEHKHFYQKWDMGKGIGHKKKKNKVSGKNSSNSKKSDQTVYIKRLTLSWLQYLYVRW